MEFLQQILSICGAVSIVGGAGAIIVKAVSYTHLDVYKRQE